MRAEETPMCAMCTHVRDFTEGAFVTFMDLQQMEYTGFCFDMIEKTQSAFDLGYYEIMNGADMRAMWTGFYRTALGFGDIYETVKCFAWATDLVQFAHFFTQLTNITGNEFFGKVSAVGQSYQATQDLWAQGNYYDAGTYLTKGLVDFAGGPLPKIVDLDFDSFKNTWNVQETLRLRKELAFSQKVAGYAGGILYGITEEESVDNFPKCVKDQEEFVQQIEESFLLIYTRHEDNVIAGLDHLYQIIDKMPTKYLRQCLKSPEAMTKLKAWSKTYSSQKVADNFATLDEQLTVEYAKANFEKKNELYWEFGDQMGAIIKIFNQ